MAFPSKPSTFALEAQSRLIKRVIKSFQSSDLKALGLSTDDVAAAENFGWRIIISAFVSSYSVSTWGDDPPTPLFEIFDLLASGYLLRMMVNRQTTESETETPMWLQYMREGRAMIKAILDPPDEGDRLSLVDSEGNEIFPRTDTATPVVVNPRDAIFFPTYADELSFGLTSDQSVEEFFTKNTREAWS